MTPFRYLDSATPEQASQTVANAPEAVFFAGGTTLIDLMKIDVMRPSTLVDVKRLPLDEIEVVTDGIHIGANVRNSHLASHPEICRRYAALSEALLSGASPQLRNMATTAGNILQRVRCGYFRDANARCNKRQPGTGCDAISGYNRSHAVLGTSDHCIATHPSDMCVAMAIFDASVRTRRPDGTTRAIPFQEFHLEPGETPHIENVLQPGELITHVDLPDLPLTWRSHYLKVRDRASYEFALSSAAVALECEGDTIRNARVALGGVATKPWRSRAAEEALAGRTVSHEAFQSAAEAALATAVPYKHNAFKIELAKRTLVAALTELTERA